MAVDGRLGRGACTGANVGDIQQGFVLTSWQGATLSTHQGKTIPNCAVNAPTLPNQTVDLATGISPDPPITYTGGYDTNGKVEADLKIVKAEIGGGLDSGVKISVGDDEALHPFPLPPVPAGSKLDYSWKSVICHFTLTYYADLCDAMVGGGKWIETNSTPQSASVTKLEVVTNRRPCEKPCLNP